jgi:hypothetical protein
MTETFDTLWSYCTESNRVCPHPPEWHQLYNMLNDTWQKPNGGWEPPLPLILGAFHDSTPLDKQLRFKEHVEWAPTPPHTDYHPIAASTLSSTQSKSKISKPNNPKIYILKILRSYPSGGSIS